MGGRSNGMFDASAVDIERDTPWSPRDVAPVAVVGRWMRRYPMGAVGATVTLTLLLLAAVGPYLVSDPLSIQGSPRESPSDAHLLGTDNLGRDVLSRVVNGSRVSMVVAVGTSFLGTSLALLLGTVGGFGGRWTSPIIQRLVDLTMAFPGLILLIGIVNVFGQSLANVILVIGILSGIRFSRVIRAGVLAIRRTMYIEAAHAMGATRTRVIVRHVVPNTFGAAMVIASTIWGTAILAEAALSFLGLGVPPPNPSWGNMISEGRQNMELAPWMVVAPGVALIVVVFGYNMLGDALRDSLDPRGRGR